MNFYRSAALALDHLDKHQGSVKGSLAAAGVEPGPGSKRVLALVIETLKYKAVLADLLVAVPVLALEKDVFRKKTAPSQPTSSSLAHVLLHDLLLSPRRKIEASDQWPPKQAVVRHQARLRAELVRVQLRRGAGRVVELAKAAASDVAARYVRWNPNVDLHREGDWSLPALHAHLAALGFKQTDKPEYPVAQGTYFVDPHLDVVLVFPPDTAWWVDDKWYAAGAVVLQDKASCMPAAVVMDGWAGGECIDATAAPGNKTSFMSALMRGEGKLHAFEKSPQRFKTLERMLKIAACRNVSAANADFLASDPAAFPAVDRILLDPSCSGSGIVNRLDYLLADAAEDDNQTERLDKLAAFQLQMILHAMKFPNVTRIVYSTCSIHAVEDEHVVMSALRAGAACGWALAPRASVLPAWARRGRPDEMGGDAALAESVIRCLPEDKTNGFFVSCFVRDGPGFAGTAERGGKRKRVERESHDAEDADGGVERAQVDERTEQGKAKTAAQLERARRKKKAQAEKRRREE
ncbi:hypothetical protein Q5752_002027 [Cryptotrichosporon argae]